MRFIGIWTDSLIQLILKIVPALSGISEAISLEFRDDEESVKQVSEVLEWDGSGVLRNVQLG